MLWNIRLLVSVRVQLGQRGVLGIPGKRGAINPEMLPKAIRRVANGFLTA